MGKSVSVCKATLMDVSNNTITTVQKKTNDLGMVDIERRGKYESHRKTDEQKINQVVSHIKFSQNGIPLL